MPFDKSFAASDFEWQPCRLRLPRFGLLLGQHGIHRRFLMPGRYLVRRSRSLRRKLYRADHGSKLT
ncbi:MAG: hypothetical protein J0H88_07205 [Sphingomonadales bacterium]|nr:hypothetical protein [Sphingomonadales bacterium]